MKKIVLKLKGGMVIIIRASLSTSQVCMVIIVLLGLLSLNNYCLMKSVYKIDANINGESFLDHEKLGWQRTKGRPIQFQRENT